MATPIWAPGTLYQPGDLVRPRSSTGGVNTPPDNPDFEDNSTPTDWTATPDGGAGSGAISTTYHFTGARSFLWAGGSGSGEGGGIGCFLVNDLRVAVVPGQSTTARCYAMSDPLSRQRHVHSGARLFFYDGSGDFIPTDSGGGFGSPGTDLDGYGQFGGTFGTTGVWRLSTITATAPANAVFMSIGAYLTSTQGDANGAYVDNFSWDYISPAASDALVFRATQPDAGFSGAVEPVWPVIVGETVYDNEVVWEGVASSRVVWEAHPILVSGHVEPDFPEIVGGAVVDNTIVWHATSRRITDDKCPHSKIVAIASSKVFAGDDDIIAYCSTVNPLDWSTENDAGYLPFGLQTYGGSPVAALGLYRSNLVASSNAGYQMWQVDPNPANMAFLDGQPVPFAYHLSLQPVANDLVGLTDQGLRSIGIAGASTNLQAGFFGKGVDPLVKPLLKAAKAAGFVPIGLMWPAAGQYWCIFGTTAIVLTVNGSSAKDMSWSRYEFPEEITDWTIDGTTLLLRAGNLVWEMNEEANETSMGCCDDVYCDPTPPVLTGTRIGVTAHLTWTPATSFSGGLEGYYVYNTDTNTLLATVGPDVLEYTTGTLEEEFTHHYQVIGFDASGEQGSNVAPVFIGGPSIPVLSGVINADPTKADLSWTAATTTGGPITGYKLYRDGSLIHTGAGTTFQDSGLANDTDYEYVVTATTAQSESADSNTVLLNTGHPDTIIDIFVADGTWTKRSGLISADIYNIGAGGGGQGGFAASGLAPGGDGGGGGAYKTVTKLAADLGSTETVTVGDGGTGGAGRSTTGTGISGIAGTNTTFGAHLTANAGQGGGTPGNGAGGAVTGGGEAGGTGGAGSSSGDASGFPGGSTTNSGAGGGGGGGSTQFGLGDGGEGGSTGTAAGGTGAAPGPNSGGNGGNATDLKGGAGGGGGGTNDVNTEAGPGGAGGNYGAGGGGGGSGSRDGGTHTGAGGPGAGGICVVVNHMS